MKTVLKHGERPFDMRGEGLFAVIEDSAVKKTCGAELFDTYNDAWKHATRQGLCPQGIFIVSPFKPRKPSASDEGGVALTLLVI